MVGPEVSNFVQKQGSSIGNLNLPFLLFWAPVNAPFSWPKISLSKRSSDNGAAVDNYEGKFFPGAVTVNIPGNKFFSGSARALNQNGERFLGHIIYLFS